MHGNNFKVQLLSDSITIENISGIKLENCFIQFYDIFYMDFVNLTCDFDIDEVKKINLSIHNFYQNSINEKKYLKIYSNHKLIHDQEFDGKTKCFLVFSNEKFQNLIEQLIVGIDKYSDEKIYHYSINYDSNLEYKNLTNIRMNIEGDVNDGQFMQFIKPNIFIDILERGYKNVVFLDADVQIRSNINNVFDYFNEIEDGPIFQKSAWDYTLVQGSYVPGPLLTAALNLPNQKYPQGVTNIMLFNQSHLNLFKKWKDVCHSDKINEIRKKEFMHDELILNCLLWKYDIKPKQFYFLVNVLNLDDVKFFYNSQVNNYYKYLDMNEYEKGHLKQSFIPYDKNVVLGFHCVKDPEIANSINNYIYRKEFFNFKNELLDFYKNLSYSSNIINSNYSEFTIINHYVNGAFLEIKSDNPHNFIVEFYNSDDLCEHRTSLSSNMWTKTNKKYFQKWKCKVYCEEELIYDSVYDATDKKVFITLDSKSIGDTLAWFPYVDEFRKKWNCKVYCSTFWNYLFKETYPEIEFIEPGQVVDGIYAMYSIGWYYNDDDTFKGSMNPNDFKESPLGKTAADILGLDFEYVKAKINLPKVEKKKRVGIAIHSTAQTKYWNNPTGWQEVVDFLKASGYEVMILSKENDDYMGNKHPVGCTKLPEGSMENLMETMLSCEFFIGVGSGLSWVSWTLGIPTFLISGFSKPISEFEGDNVFRIFNDSVCNGCYNRYRLDAGDWNWCPDHKGTERQFECTKSITGEMVINTIMKSGLIKVSNLDKDILPEFHF